MWRWISRGVILQHTLTQICLIQPECFTWKTLHHGLGRFPDVLLYRLLFFLELTQNSHAWIYCPQITNAYRQACCQHSAGQPKPSAYWQRTKIKVKVAYESAHLKTSILEGYDTLCYFRFSWYYLFGSIKIIFLPLPNTHKLLRDLKNKKLCSWKSGIL